MPELPEVEVTRAGLAPRLTGARIHAVRLGKPLRWPYNDEPQALVGLTLGEAQRRGKYLWLPLRDEADGRDAGGLLLHLGMSGSLALTEAPPPAGVHDHFELATSRGTLRLTDPRRFGAVLRAPALDAPPAAALLAKLGPEPFDPALTSERFHATLRQRRAPIKAVLLAGDAVVGAGNIYASEALFRAGIDPRTRADRVSRPRAERLLAEVRATLARAIAVGGSTLRDFKDVHGMGGEFQAEAQVYGREGQPCPRCGRPIRRLVQNQRATYYCASCQKR